MGTHENNLHTTPEDLTPAHEARMLSDDQISLVSAAVDRELSPNQVGPLRSLLKTSPEAERLYQQFSEISTSLSQLPKYAAPPELRLNVLRQIEPVIVRPRRAWPVITTMTTVIAASAVLAVSIGMYLKHQSKPEVVLNTAPEPPTRPPVAAPQPPTEQPVYSPSPETAPSPPDQASPKIPDRIADNSPSPLAPKSVVVPRSAPRDLHGAPVFAPPPLTKIEVTLPLLMDVSDLDRSEAKARLRSDLTEEGPFRLDLFCHEPHRGADILLTLARQGGVTISSDAATRDRMKKKIPSVSYAIYTDSLLPDEVVRLMDALAEWNRRPDQAVFTQAHLTPLRDADRKDLKDLLGADPDAPRKQRDKAADAMKVKPGDKTGVLLTYLPPTGRTNPLLSKEIRDYLARRDDRKTGAVSLLLTIRPINP